MKSRFLFGVLVLVVSSSLAAGPIDLRRIMLQFDEAYIPLWFFAEAGDLENAQTAWATADQRWQRLEQTLHLVLPEGVWEDHLERAEGWLADAQTGMEANRLDLATVSLEHARFELIALRKSLGMVDYFPDQLYQLHANLDLLAEIAEDPKLCLLEWNEVEQLIHKAVADWHHTRAIPTDWMHRPDNKEEGQLWTSHYEQINFGFQAILAAHNTGQQDILARSITRTDAAVLALIYAIGEPRPAAVFYAPAPGADEQNTSKTF